MRGSDFGEIDGSVVGSDWIAFPLAEVLVAEVAEEGTYGSCLVVVVDGEPSPASESTADCTASLLFFEYSSILSLFKSVGLLDVPVVGAVKPGLFLGPFGKRCLRKSWHSAACTSLRC
jgi:hypothetical protein